MTEKMRYESSEDDISRCPNGQEHEWEDVGVRTLSGTLYLVQECERCTVGSLDPLE